jgi:hypothetical protein
MLTLGLILLVIGAVVAVAAHRPLGLVLVAIGAVLVLVDVIDTNSAAVLGAFALPVGGRPRRSDVAAPMREPVLLAFIAAATPIVCAFVLQVLEATDVLDSALWLRTLLTGLGAVVGALAALWARLKVTPLADPQTETGEALVPAGRVGA